MTNASPKAAAAKSELEQELEKQQGLLSKEQSPAKAAQEETTEAERVSRKFDLENNPFYQVAFDDSLTNAQKRDEVIKLRTYNTEETPEENMERLAQLELFKEYMMYERKRMAQDMIDLTDPQTYVELHDMLNQLASTMIAFDESLEPLKALIDALDKLGNAGDPGLVIDIYKSLDDDDAAKAKWSQELAKQKGELDDNIALEKANERRMVKLQNTKTIFKNVKGWAQRELADLEITQRELSEKIRGADGTGGQLAAYAQKIKEEPVEQFPEWAAEKAKLRELKEVTGEEWEQRARTLIRNAQNSINTIDVRGNSVKEHKLLERTNIDGLDSANGDLRAIYAMMGDAENRAGEKNDGVYQELKNAPESDEYMDNVVRDRALKAVSLYINESKNSAEDTEEVRNELNAQSATLTAFRAENVENVRAARRLVSSTNASMAEGMVTTLLAVTGAATDQARILAEDATTVRKHKNGETIRAELNRMANNAGARAISVKEAIAEMDKLQKNVEGNTEKARTGMQQTREAIDEMASRRTYFEEALRKLDSTAAESESQDTGTSGSFNKASERPDAANDDGKRPADKQKSGLKGFNQGKGYTP